jgi:hypothetical protein
VPQVGFAGKVAQALVDHAKLAVSEFHAALDQTHSDRMADCLLVEAFAHTRVVPDFQTHREVR